MEDIIGEIYDLIRTIRDPERPESLEDLDVVREECVQAGELGEDFYDVIVYYKPTVEHWYGIAQFKPLVIKNCVFSCQYFLLSMP